MKEAKRRMAYAEFVEQLAYYRLFPWGDDWQQAAAISASVSNASPKFRRIDLSKFFPKSRREIHETSIVGMFEAMREIAVSRGK